MRLLLSFLALTVGQQVDKGESACCAGPPCQDTRRLKGLWCGLMKNESGCHGKTVGTRPCVWITNEGGKGKCTKGWRAGILGVPPSAPQCPPDSPQALAQGKINAQGAERQVKSLSRYRPLKGVGSLNVPDVMAKTLALQNENSSVYPTFHKGGSSHMPAMTAQALELAAAPTYSSSPPPKLKFPPPPPPSTALRSPPHSPPPPIILRRRPLSSPPSTISSTLPSRPHAAHRRKSSHVLQAVVSLPHEAFSLLHATFSQLEKTQPLAPLREKWGRTKLGHEVPFAVMAAVIVLSVGSCAMCCCLRRGIIRARKSFMDWFRRRRQYNMYTPLAEDPTLASLLEKGGEEDD
mmetsp:Transcript_28554/g.87374  ORF Transcript_28554/g.87374 Transcript_28554/m.87374 type:complete len:349 (+) Transcript_28554:103-1149(+)